MQYVVIGKDGDDEAALDRRMAVRADHIALGDEMVASGNMLFGVATLDASGRMNGSILVVDFDSRDALDDWLAVEPYVVGKVWQSVEVTECRVGQSFAHLLATASNSASTDG